MNQFLDRIIKLCELSKVTVYKLEKDCGFSTNSVMKWENSMPSLDRVMRVAQYFDVSIDYLAGNTNNPNSHKQDFISDTEMSELITVFEKLYSVTSEFKQLVDSKHYVRFKKVIKGE